MASSTIPSERYAPVRHTTMWGGSMKKTKGQGPLHGNPDELIVNIRNSKMYSELLDFNDQICRAEAMFKRMRSTTDDFIVTCTEILAGKTPHVYLEHDSAPSGERNLGVGMDAKAMRQALSDYKDRVQEKVLKPINEWKLGFRTANNSVDLLKQRCDAVLDRKKKLEKAQSRTLPKIESLKKKIRSRKDARSIERGNEAVESHEQYLYEKEAKLSSARMAFNSMEMEVFEQLKSLAEDCTGIKALVAMMMDENATLMRSAIDAMGDLELEPLIAEAKRKGPVEMGAETPTPPMEPKLTPVSPVSEEVAAIGGIEQGIPRAARERAMGEVVAMEKQEGRSIGGGSQAMEVCSPVGLEDPDRTRDIASTSYLNEDVPHPDSPTAKHAHTHAAVLEPVGRRHRPAKQQGGGSDAHPTSAVYSSKQGPALVLNKQGPSMLAPLGPFQAASAERGVKGSVKAPVKGPVKGPYQAQSTTERVMKGPMTSPFHAQSTERAMRGGRGGMGGGLQMGAGVAEREGGYESDEEDLRLIRVREVHPGSLRVGRRGPGSDGNRNGDGKKGRKGKKGKRGKAALAKSLPGGAVRKQASALRWWALLRGRGRGGGEEGGQQSVGSEEAERGWYQVGPGLLCGLGGMSRARRTPLRASEVDELLGVTPTNTAQTGAPRQGGMSQGEGERGGGGAGGGGSAGAEMGAGAGGNAGAGVEGGSAGVGAETGASIASPDTRGVLWERRAVGHGSTNPAILRMMELQRRGLGMEGAGERSETDTLGSVTPPSESQLQLLPASYTHLATRTALTRNHHNRGGDGAVHAGHKNGGGEGGGAGGSGGGNEGGSWGGNGEEGARGSEGGGEGGDRGGSGGNSGDGGDAYNGYSLLPANVDVSSIQGSPLSSPGAVSVGGVVGGAGVEGGSAGGGAGAGGGGSGVGAEMGGGAGGSGGAAEGVDWSGGDVFGAAEGGAGAEGAGRDKARVWVAVDQLKHSRREASRLLSGATPDWHAFRPLTSVARMGAAARGGDGRAVRRALREAGAGGEWEPVSVCEMREEGWEPRPGFFEFSVGESSVLHASRARDVQHTGSLPTDLDLNLNEGDLNLNEGGGGGGVGGKMGGMGSGVARGRWWGGRQ